MRRLALVLLPLLLGAVDASAATPPARPRAGLPGGLDSPDVDIVRQAVGRAGAVTYAFYAAGKPDAPRPVAVFLHGWGAVNPVIYGGWIDHLARKGWLVLFPAFQTVGQTRPADATAARRASSSRTRSRASRRIPAARPDLTRVGLIGHSAGAGIAVNLAAEARSLDLPVPKLVFAVMPGGIASDAASRGVPLADLAEDRSVDRPHHHGRRPRRRSRRPRLAPHAAGGERAAALEEAVHADRVGRSRLPDPLGHARLAGGPEGGLRHGDDQGRRPTPPRDPKAARAQRPKWSADMVLSGEQTVLLGQLQRNAVGHARLARLLEDLRHGGRRGLHRIRRHGGAPVKDPAFLDMGRWSDGWPVRRLAAETPKAVDPTATAATPARVAPAPTKMPVTRQRSASPPRVMLRRRRGPLEPRQHAAAFSHRPRTAAP